MDYWPNIDAVSRFVRDMLPQLKARWPALRFHIVGRAPTAAVLALANADVHVTGTVPDVRPYLQHAATVVAPLRLARGIQNKVLEAMAMACPVVTAPGCAAAIASARVPDELHSAAAEADYVHSIHHWLADPDAARAVGVAARERVLSDYSWPAQLAAIDRHLDGLGALRPLAA